MLKYQKDIIQIITITAITITVVICVRIFLIASFRIPSPSMEPTLQAGDFILTNKLIPGPRMDWLYLFGKEDYKRVKGIRKIKRDDILVFNPPYHMSDVLKTNLDVYYVKRCFGIPGDSLYLDQYGSFHLLKKNSPAPQKDALYIPKKGDEIQLDSINFQHYKNIIAYETNAEHTIKEYYKYRFQYNYYIVTGDNPSDSEDSRFWGLLPETHIVGKASYIWRSVDPHTKKIRWNRFLKPLS